MKFIEETEVSEMCIFYLMEVNKQKGKISRGNIDHDHLTRPDSFSGGDKVKMEYYNTLNKGQDEALKEKFIIKADNGSSDSFIMHKISERGYALLKQLNIEKI